MTQAKAVSGALADPEDVRATPQATRADRRRIKELERDVLRNYRALAERRRPCHVCLVLDLYSRKIVSDDSDHAHNHLDPHRV